MKTSENGIALIERHEGYAAQVYNDAGHEAIGYGHDLQPGESFAGGVTQEEADALLRTDLAERFEPAVNAVIIPECTQNQYDALVDFAYNLGVASLRTMVAHGWEYIPEQMIRWTRINGEISAGLVARREEEATLFIT